MTTNFDILVDESKSNKNECTCRNTQGRPEVSAEVKWEQKKGRVWKARPQSVTLDNQHTLTQRLRRIANFCMSGLRSAWLWLRNRLQRRGIIGAEISAERNVCPVARIKQRCALLGRASDWVSEWVRCGNGTKAAAICSRDMSVCVALTKAGGLAGGRATVSTVLKSERHSKPPFSEWLWIFCRPIARDLLLPFLLMNEKIPLGWLSLCLFPPCSGPHWSSWAVLLLFIISSSLRPADQTFIQVDFWRTRSWFKISRSAEQHASELVFFFKVVSSVALVARLLHSTVT